MINLYTLHPTSSLVMYPDNDVTGSAISKYELILTQTLDESQTTIPYTDIRRLNTNVAANKSSVYVMAVSSGSIPSPDGQYTAQLYVGDFIRSTFGDNNLKYGTTHLLWSDVSSFSNRQLISTDRAYVHGSNLQDITTYTGTDQTGAYTTYNS